MVAHEGDSYSLVESSVVHLSFVGLARFSYYRKETYFVCISLNNIPSRTIEDSLSRLELEVLSDLLYTPDFLNSCCYFELSWTIVNLTHFPVDTILGIL